MSLPAVIFTSPDEVELSDKLFFFALKAAAKFVKLFAALMLISPAVIEALCRRFEEMFLFVVLSVSPFSR